MTQKPNQKIHEQIVALCEDGLCGAGRAARDQNIMKIQNIIAEIVTKRGYEGAIAANPRGSILFQIGDPNPLEWKGMLSKNL